MVEQVHGVRATSKDLHGHGQAVDMDRSVIEKGSSAQVDSMAPCTLRQGISDERPEFSLIPIPRTDLWPMITGISGKGLTDLLVVTLRVPCE